MSKSHEPAAADLREELAELIEDILDVARSRTGLDQEKIDELRQGLRDRLDQIGSDAGAVTSRIADQAGEALTQADRYAHEKPWQLAAAAGLIGLAVGVLLSRR
jgi:ElaB/YqjD/DUF883 family membrane-anchored ribosome-binding protein